MPIGVYKRTKKHLARLKKQILKYSFSKSGRKLSFTSRKKQAKTMLGHTVSIATRNKIRRKLLLKDGTRRIYNGYVNVYDSKHPRRRRVFEHHLIIEKYIRRLIRKGEEGHHINGIKTDNRPQNLMLFRNKSAHTRFENKLLLKKSPIKKSDIIFDGRLLP